MRIPVDMSNKIFDEIDTKLRETYPNRCILWIDAIQNDLLEKNFDQQKQAIISKRGDEEVKIMSLFHGTSENAINSIVDTGFDPTYNRTSAYGKGTYFAISANYSKDYAKPKQNEISFMMICDVIVGKCVQGTCNMEIDTNKYDNSVNNMKTPSIYVTPYANGAIPRYVIAFHRNAPM